jgi:HEAT repeat protein
MAGRAKQAELQRKVETERADAAVRQLLQKALEEEQLEPGKGIKALIDCFKPTSASESVDVLFKRRTHAVAAVVVEPLLCELESGNTPEEAAIALGNIGDRRAVDALLKALEDRDSFVRQYAARALGQIGDIRAVEPLIVALHNKDNDSVQESAARALGKIRDSRALRHLVATLNDRKADETLRTAAATALGDLGDRSAVKTLITTLGRWDGSRIHQERSRRRIRRDR